MYIHLYNPDFRGIFVLKAKLKKPFQPSGLNRHIASSDLRFQNLVVGRIEIFGPVPGAASVDNPTKLIGGFKHFLFSISYMGCHPSHWRTHIFQDGLLHHQPENDDSSKGISTTRNGQTKHASHERLEIQHVAQPCAGSSIFFIQMKPANAATTMQVECSTFQESIQEQVPFSPKQKKKIQPEPHSTLCNEAIICNH